MYRDDTSYRVLDGHAFLKKFAGSCLDKAARGGQPLSIVALRIDGFDDLRESRGEQAAHAAVQQVHDFLKSETRASDLGGRLAGGDLIVVAPDTGYTGAWLMAERIRKAVEQTDFEAETGLTVSIGVAEYDTGDGLSMLVGRAREALAEAVNSGGNQVCVQPAMEAQAVN